MTDVTQLKEDRRDMKFRSKIDWWMHLTFLLSVALNVWLLVYCITHGGAVMFVLLLLFTPLNMLLIVPVWINTYYLLDENGLVIKCGLGKRYTIPYESIINAVSTKDLIASAALSLDRIELKYRKEQKKFSDTVLISPVNKQEFFTQLHTKSEDIIIITEAKPIDKSYKIFVTVILVITGVVLLGSAIMCVVGEFDPTVRIREEGITISSMYGLHIGMNEITGITLIEESMHYIPGSGGIRTNGFDGFGQAQKGYFTSPAFGMNIRFVQAKTSPTIHIECRTYSVFISFRDSEKTRALFEEMRHMEW